jgi:hypothetical protein
MTKLPQLHHIFNSDQHFEISLDLLQGKFQTLSNMLCMSDRTISLKHTFPDNTFLIFSGQVTKYPFTPIYSLEAIHYSPETKYEHWPWNDNKPTRAHKIISATGLIFTATPDVQVNAIQTFISTYQ